MSRYKPATHAGIKWVSDEVSHLRRHYPERGSAALAAELGRTAAAVQRKAHELGLRVRPELAEARRESRRRSAAAAHGCRGWGEFMATRRRRKYQYQWPGCVSGAEVRACRLLAEMGPMTSRGLAEAAGVGRTSSGRVLRRLAAAGVLGRRSKARAGDAGGREWVYELLARGRGAYSKRGGAA